MGLMLPKDLRRALTAPELLVPGRIPKAPAIKVRQDGHWAADQLAVALVPVNGVMHDVVNGNQATRGGSLTRYKDGAYVPEFDNTYADTFPLIDPWQFKHPNGGTVVCVFDWDTITGRRFLAQCGTGTDQGWQLWADSTTAGSAQHLFFVGYTLSNYRGY